MCHHFDYYVRQNAKIICLYSDVSLREINYISGLRENELNSSIPQEDGVFSERSFTEIVISHNDIYYSGGNVKGLLEKFRRI